MFRFWPFPQFHEINEKSHNFFHKIFLRIETLGIPVKLFLLRTLFFYDKIYGGSTNRNIINIILVTYETVREIYYNQKNIQHHSLGCSTQEKLVISPTSEKYKKSTKQDRALIFSISDWKSSQL